MSKLTIGVPVDYNAIYKYQGYKSAALDGTDFKRAHHLENAVRYVYDKHEYSTLSKAVDKLDPMSLDDVITFAKEFYNNHLYLHSVSKSNATLMKKNQIDIDSCKTASEACDKINALLTDIDPFDLPVKIVKAKSYNSKLVKPIINISEYCDEPNRKVYFEQILLGEQLNGLSVGSLIREIAQTQQERNIGFAEDYLNSKIISLFLEKVALKELDDTRELLRLSEKVRFSELASIYSIIKRRYTNAEKPDVNDLLNAKSLLLSIRLFDDYCNARRQADRDAFFDEIQNVFDGKQTVEDILRSRDISYTTSMTPAIFGRHS